MGAIHLAKYAWHEKDTRSTSWTNNRSAETEQKVCWNPIHRNPPNFQVIGRFDASYFIHIDANSLSDHRLVVNAALHQGQDGNGLFRNVSWLSSAG